MNLAHKKISITPLTNKGYKTINMDVKEGLEIASKYTATEWLRFSSFANTLPTSIVSDINMPRINFNERFQMGCLFLQTWASQPDFTLKTLEDVDGLLSLKQSMMVSSRGRSEAGNLRALVQLIRNANNPYLNVLTTHYQSALLTGGFKQALRAANTGSPLRFTDKFKGDIGTALIQISPASIIQYQGALGLQAAVEGIENRSVDYFNSIAHTIYQIAGFLDQLKAELHEFSFECKQKTVETEFVHFKLKLMAQHFGQILHEDSRDSLFPNTDVGSVNFLQCRGKNGQNMYGVVTFLRDTLWAMKVLKDTLLVNSHSSNACANEKSGDIMVQPQSQSDILSVIDATLKGLEKPITKILRWFWSAPRDRRLDWWTSFVLDDVKALIKTLWGADQKATQRLLAPLCPTYKPSFVCTVS